MIIHHILVPLDFSATADQALAYAIAFTMPLQARLTLLHVLQIPPLTLEEGATALSGTYLEDLETEAHHLLQASLAQVQRAGLQGACLLVQGTPTQAIVDTAGAQEVDSDHHGDPWTDRADPCAPGKCGRTRRSGSPVPRAGYPEDPRHVWDPGDVGNFLACATLSRRARHAYGEETRSRKAFIA